MEELLFIEYPKCSTCRAAKAFLEERGVRFADRHIVEQPPTAEELKRWIAASGLPFRRFFNTSGLVYKALGLKERLPAMREDEAVALLASDGMLIKRPLLIGGGRVTVGFRREEWEALFPVC